MTDQTQLLREAAQQALEDLLTASSFTSIASRNRLPKTIERLQRALAQPAEGGEPLFILHCGQIDSSGEQDEWETEANGQQRVDDFCRLHPGKKIKLYPAPPASQEQAQQAASRLEIAADRAEVAKVLRRVSRALDVSTDERTILCHAAAMVELDGQAQQPKPQPLKETP